ncbi:MAG: hypothetical protein Q8P39_02340 [Candidatus Yanofskybacteria bacterium]|nr:hypothetical protein [Candidatus Yanofskybacteria bacterium]
MEHEPIYVCEGECSARLTEQEYQDHPTKVCGAASCSHQGKPFVKKEAGSWTQNKS